MKVFTFIRTNTHKILFLVFALFYLFKLNQVCTTYNRYDKTINEDAFGYYLILPTVFEYKDPNFQFLDTVLSKTNRYSSYIPPVVNTLENGEQVCKYFSGVAVMQMPFYLSAKLFDRNKSTGFEQYYHSTILVASAFYLLLGFYGLMLVLIRIGIPKMLAVLLLPLVLFGSNLYAYATYDIAYSHVYSFFTLVFLIYFALKFKSSQTFRDGISMGLFFGLLIIIRPLNGIAILFFPVLFSFQDIRTLFSKGVLLKIIIAFFSVIFMLFIQSALWFWQTGLWYLYPYGEEKLNLSDPKLYDLVFGFNCGWAIYSPLPFLLLVLSLIFLLIQRKYRQFTWALVSSFSILYLLSCWYYLHYGCTVGCRPITEFYAPLLILFAYSIKSYIKTWWFKFILSPTLIALIFYNQMMHYQFFENIINWCEMDQKRFEMVFFKTHKAYNYSTSAFWDFSKFDKDSVVREIEINKTLKIDEDQHQDSFSQRILPISHNDSTLLFNIHLKGKLVNKLNDSYLRLLVTDAGQYVDLLNLLLVRKINQKDRETEFIYQFHVNKSIEKGNLHFSLESVEREAISELQIQKIEIKRIKLD